MQPVPYLLLAALILWKEFVLWYYHRVMPPLVKAALVVPGVALAVVYIIFSLGGVDPQFHEFVSHAMIAVFFIWNGLFVFFTRDQHRSKP